jgi:hypothetical protein
MKYYLVLLTACVFPETASASCPHLTTVYTDAITIEELHSTRTANQYYIRPFSKEVWNKAVRAWTDATALDKKNTIDGLEPVSFVKAVAKQSKWTYLIEFTSLHRYWYSEEIIWQSLDLAFVKSMLQRSE